MTAERTKYIWKGRRCVGRHKMNDVAKAMFAGEAVRWEQRTDIQKWNQLEHNIGRAVRGDALAPLSTSGEILTSEPNFLAPMKIHRRLDLMGLALVTNVPFPAKPVEHLVHYETLEFRGSITAHSPLPLNLTE